MISQIVTRYKSRGLRGKLLREALLRHAAILTGCDPAAARELRARTNGMAGGRPKGCKPKPTRKETLDPIRQAWLEHDKRNGLTRD